MDVTPDELIEMDEKEVDSTTEEVATPIKKQKMEHNKSAKKSLKVKMKTARKRAKEIFQNLSGMLIMFARAYLTFVHI